MTALLVSGAVAPGTTPNPEQITTVEMPGAVPDPSLMFSNQDGKSVALGQYFDGTRPVLLVMAYYRCPMLCTLVLNGVNDGIRELAWTLGEQYRVVAVSFDPRDGANEARGKRTTYLKEYARHATSDGWDFLVGDEAPVRRLADSIGFHYQWMEDSQEYIHQAAVFVFSPKGVLSRTLFGTQHPPANLRRALVQASEGKLGGVLDWVELFVLEYDAATRSYVMVGTRVAALAVVPCVAALALVLLLRWRKTRASLGVGTAGAPPY